MAKISAPASESVSFKSDIAKSLIESFNYELNEKVTLGTGPSVTNPATGVTAGKFQTEVAEIKKLMAELADIDDPEVIKSLQAAQAALDKLAAPPAGGAPAGNAAAGLAAADGVGQSGPGTPAGGSGNPPAGAAAGATSGSKVDAEKLKRFGQLLDKIKGPTSVGAPAGGAAAAGAPAGGAASGGLLKVGSRGAEVEKVQKALGIAVDGQYGPATKAAVTKYQQQNGLKVDGIVGPETKAKLFGTSESINETTELSRILKMSSILLERGGLVPVRPPVPAPRPGGAVVPKPGAKAADDVIDVTAKEVPAKAGSSVADKVAAGALATGGAAVVGGAIANRDKTTPAGTDASGRRTAATDPRIPGNAPAGRTSDAGAGQSSSAFAAQDPRRLDLKKPGAAAPSAGAAATGAATGGAAAPAGGSGNPASALSKQELDELDAIARELQSSQDPSVIELMGQYNALRPKLGAATPVPGEPE